MARALFEGSAVIRPSQQLRVVHLQHILKHEYQTSGTGGSPKRPTSGKGRLLGLDISLLGAFVAGLISFGSPCVLPLVPPYLCFLAGVSFEQLSTSEPTGATRLRVLASAVAFVAGFTTVFVALGATATTLGRLVAEHLDTLSIIAGALIFIMGMHFAGLFRMSWLYQEARVHVERKPAGALGAYIVGLAFAFGWTPCVGPVLAAILFVAGTEDTALRGASLLAVSSLGIGIPFILAGVFASRFIGWANRFKKHMHRIEQAMGVLLILTGILFMTGQMSRIAQWLLETFPAFAMIG